MSRKLNVRLPRLAALTGHKATAVESCGEVDYTTRPFKFSQKSLSKTQATKRQRLRILLKVSCCSSAVGRNSQVGSLSVFPLPRVCFLFSSVGRFFCRGWGIVLFYAICFCPEDIGLTDASENCKMGVPRESPLPSSPGPLPLPVFS